MSERRIHLVAATDDAFNVKHLSRFGKECVEVE